MMVQHRLNTLGEPRPNESIGEVHARRMKQMNDFANKFDTYVRNGSMTLGLTYLDIILSSTSAHSKRLRQVKAYELDREMIDFVKQLLKDHPGYFSEEAESMITLMDIENKALITGNVSFLQLRK